MAAQPEPWDLELPLGMGWGGKLWTGGAETVVELTPGAQPELGNVVGTQMLPCQPKAWSCLLSPAPALQ